MNARHIGSDFDSFLREEGILAECEAMAHKRVVTWHALPGQEGLRPKEAAGVSPGRKPWVNVE